MSRLVFAGLAFVASLSFCLHAHADTITWGSAQSTTAASDVSLNGTVVSAFNGGADDTTVVGVLFTGSDFLSGPGTSPGMLQGATTGDDAFDVLLDQIDFGGGGDLVSIDLGSFTSGNEYEVQVFFTDQRTNSNDRVMQYGSQDSNGVGASTVDLIGDPNGGGAGSPDPSSPYGSFAIGTFTANGDDPDLTLDAQGFGNAHITAFQVRDLTVVPEPAGLVVLSVGMVGLIARRRRNK